MNTSQVGVLIVWLTTSLTIVLLVAFGLPALARTIFRERLEAIRDDCLDAVLAGELPACEPVRHFLLSVSVEIQIAADITFARAFMAMRSLRQSGCSVPPPQAPSLGELQPAQRKLLHALHARTDRALRSYLIWGSIPGWCLAPLALGIQHGVSSRRRAPSPSKGRTAGRMASAPKPSEIADVDRLAKDYNKSEAFFFTRRARSIDYEREIQRLFPTAA